EENPLAASQEDNYNWAADQTLYSLKKGVSTLTGHVRLTRPQQELTSDVAYLYPDKNTGKIHTITGVGNVRLREPDKLVIAKKGDVNLKTKMITLHDVLYRLSIGTTKMETIKEPKTKKIENRTYTMTAWGQATKAEQIKPGKMEMQNATYTTCPPNGDLWKIKASSIHLDTKAGRGYSVNNRFLFKGIPFFYLPYFNFPINKDRHTGFLLPSYTRTRSAGVTIALPFYWNIAPNYDATITPTAMYKRGVLWDGNFRYLTEKNSGQLGLEYIFNDRAFHYFQKTAGKDWGSSPTFNALQNDSDNRRALSWQNHTQWSPYWQGDVDYNSVSDDYFVQDFSRNILDNSNNQLLRQAQIDYLGSHWNFLGNVQDYQTLHPVNQGDVENQYAQIPQLQLNSDFPDQWLGLDYAVNTEFVRFWMARNPKDITKPLIGDRMSVRPAISLPIQWPFAFFTPRVQLQATKYDLSRTPSQLPTTPGIVIPIFDVSTGLYFDRNVHLFHYQYRQTLEPQVYYLYVPFRDQFRIPVFNTSTQSFSYNSLFLDNQFVGVDRIGDANQVTLGLTTRFIDDNTGDQKASASIGQIRYFNDRRVNAEYGSSADSISSTDKRSVSPIAALGTYNFDLHWSANAGTTWNSLINKFDNQNVALQYQTDAHHIINTGYNYVRGGDVIPGEPSDSPRNDLKQTDIGAYWALNNRWSLMGRWNYNWSHTRAQAFLYGVAYESCCWAVRFVMGRTLLTVGPSPRFHTEYDDLTSLQIAFKGLGDVGTGGSPDDFLSSGILGYTDTFGKDN
ncbi:MAG: hypothetical protein A3H43_05645, partial [Gammaproteobacteria bacterium RIFCSPLOWO2_02_FULL_42_9]